MLKSRKLWAWCAAAAAVLAVAWVGWQVWQVNRDLNDAVRHAEALERAVGDRDDAASERAVTGLRASSSSASERTSGVTWSILAHLPVLGDDVRGVRTTAQVLDGIARDGVEPVLMVSDRFEELLPTDGKIDVELLKELRRPVQAASLALDDADARLEGVDSSGFVGRLRTRFDDFARQVAQASDALSSADTATSVLPPMLGVDGPRHYLLVFQNNAEIRATGGLAGAASYVEARDGALKLRRHVPGMSLGELEDPVLPLSETEKKLYGDVLGTYFVNAGMTPDIARASDLMRARWEREFPRENVDGVIMIDAVAISYLLRASGPIVVDGVELNADNVVDELLHKTYLRLSDPDDQDAFFAKVAAETFDMVTAGVDDPAALLRGLRTATDERRVFVHLFDDGLQAELESTQIAGGSFAQPDASAPHVVVTLDDTTGAKMSYFLRYDVDVTPTSCVGGVQSYSAKARLRSLAPPDAARLPDYITGSGAYGVPPGVQIVTFRVFGPTKGSVSELSINGSSTDSTKAQSDGRPVKMTYVQLAPGQSVDLTWTMKSGKGQEGDTALAVTPTIEKTKSGQVLKSACSAGR